MVLAWELMKNCWWALIIIVIQAYLLGSVNFAIIVTRRFIHADIRSFGSGNAGATNVLRTQGIWPAAITMTGDIAKSAAAVAIGGVILTSALSAAYPANASDFGQVSFIGKYLAGLGCILGHLYPVFFNFRGGKGVASSFGLMLILDWRVAIVCLVIFVVTVAISKMVSLGSIIGSAMFPVMTFVFRSYIYHQPTYIVVICTVMSALLAGLVIFKHHTNIKKIISGTESHISFK